MDLGRFERSRRQFWLWITVPILLILLATVPSLVYRSHVRQDLRERENVLAGIPATERAAEEIDALVKAVTPSAVRLVETTEAATRRLDQAAKSSGLTVRSLKVSEETVDTDGFKSVRMNVQIQGSLPSVVQWLDALQKPGMLITVQGATLNALSLPPSDEFAGDVALYLRLRKEG
jgi:hypothetical protein